MPKDKTNMARLQFSMKSKAPVYVMTILTEEVTNTCSIFGITEIMMVTGVVERFAAPKGVDGFVFDFFKVAEWG